MIPRMHTKKDRVHVSKEDLQDVDKEGLKQPLFGHRYRRDGDIFWAFQDKDRQFYEVPDAEMAIETEELLKLVKEDNVVGKMAAKVQTKSEKKIQKDPSEILTKKVQDFHKKECSGMGNIGSNRDRTYISKEDLQDVDKEGLKQPLFGHRYRRDGDIFWAFQDKDRQFYEVPDAEMAIETEELLKLVKEDNVVGKMADKVQTKSEKDSQNGPSASTAKQVQRSKRDQSPNVVKKVEKAQKKEPGDLAKKDQIIDEQDRIKGKSLKKRKSDTQSDLNNQLKRNKITTDSQ